MDQEIITTSELGLKFKSKKEVHQLMTTQGNVYMPPIKLNNHDYVEGVIEGSIKVGRAESITFVIAYQNKFSLSDPGPSNQKSVHRRHFEFC